MIINVLCLSNRKSMYCACISFGFIINCDNVIFWMFPFQKGVGLIGYHRKSSAFLFVGNVFVAYHDTHPSGAGVSRTMLSRRSVFVEVLRNG